VIRLGHRGIALGMPGQGKSQMCAHLFAVHEGQRLLIDVQDHYELGPDAGEDAIDVDRVSAIDWRARTIRYTPRRFSAREFNELYGAIYHRGDVLVWLDEALGPTSAHSTPMMVRRVITQGRKRRITHLATSQRPAGIERGLVSLSEHVWVFRMVDPDDIQTVSTRLGLSPRELGEELRQLPHQGFLYHEAGSGPIRQFGPLPAGLVARAQRIVHIPA